jgi:phosphatidylserine/phosphatidylglycerophosphate/cardiolipin synthase-like enzyme
MNIREGCLLELRPRHPMQDLHFRVEGPVVAHLQEVLADDWAFTTGEVLREERWFPRLEPAGEALARGIADGPDEDFERLRLTRLGAITSARSSVAIVTPYFLPDAALITTLNVAAMRGVEVDILVPAEGNLRVVQWAAPSPGCNDFPLVRPGATVNRALRVVGDPGIPHTTSDTPSTRREARKTTMQPASPGRPCRRTRRPASDRRGYSTDSTPQAAA